MGGGCVAVRRTVVECGATRSIGQQRNAPLFTSSAHAPAAGGGQGFNREPRTMGERRLAKRGVDVRRGAMFTPLASIPAAGVVLTVLIVDRQRLVGEAPCCSAWRCAERQSVAVISCVPILGLTQRADAQSSLLRLAP